MQSDQNIYTILQRYERFGVDLGLARIESLLAALGNPQEQVPIVHVAGTNGKGSVCAYLSSVLGAAGYRVGRYTSPHLVRWNERICINGQSIESDALLSQLVAVEAAIEPNQPTPTQFEVFTAAAWRYFAEQQVNIAVIEVGLGGRLDATNVCAIPLVTVITSISLEHWQRLGPTVAHIAREKAGILKRGRPVVAGQLPPIAADVVTQRASELDCFLHWVDPAQALGGLSDARLQYGLPGMEPVQYSQALLGEHQRQNSAIAIATLQLLQSQGWTLSPAAIQQGMAEAEWPGRLQWIRWQNHKILLDGAHNPAAAKVLRQYVDSYLADNLTPKNVPEQALETGLKSVSGSADFPRVAWLMGMLTTKDHQAVFKALLRPGDSLHLVPVSGHLSAEPKELASVADSVCPTLTTVQCHRSLVEGLNALVAEPMHCQIFCGSLYLMGEFFEAFL